MSYRDDLEAARARAEALERELAELRDRQATAERDVRALADERRLQLLERAKLREQLEQARRDAEAAQRDAEKAQRDAEAARAEPSPRALAHPGPHALSADQRRAIARTGALFAVIALVGAIAVSPVFLTAALVSLGAGVALAIGRP